MPQTLHAAWTSTVERKPRAKALVEAESGRVWTRKELDARALEWRRALPFSRSELAGRRIGLACRNGPDWIAAFLGLCSWGAVPVLIDVSEPPDRRLQTAESLGAFALWSDGQWRRLATRAGRLHRRICLAKVTSGSTGQPKAWFFTHAQMLADGRQICATMGIRAADLNLLVIPLGHSYGLGNVLVPLLEQGTPIVCADSFLPSALATVCETWRPTVFPAVPALLEALAGSSVEASSLGSLRRVISAGARLQAPTARAFLERFGLRIHNFYGTSETGGICYDATGNAALSGGSVGAPLKGVRIQEGRAGRFTVQSPAVTGTGSFSPADLGHLDERGELVLVGRVGRQVKLGARRVDLGEVELALRRIDGVIEARVLVDKARPHTLVAGVVAPGLSSVHLAARLRGAIAAWKIPRRIVVMGSMPTGPRGKVDVGALAGTLRAKAP